MSERSGPTAWPSGRSPRQVRWGPKPHKRPGRTLGRVAGLGRQRLLCAPSNHRRCIAYFFRSLCLFSRAGALMGDSTWRAAPYSMQLHMP